MAERKSGPVRPPVIDLEAREAPSKPAAGAEPAGGADEAPKADPAPSIEAAAAASRSRSRATARPAKPATSTDGEATSPEQAAEPVAALEPQPALPPEPHAVIPEPQPAPPPPPEPPQATPPPRPPARLAMPWSAISIAVIGGAVLGAGLTYIAANWIALPNVGPSIADPAPALATLEERASGLDARLTAAEEAARNTRVSLDATLVQLDTGLGEVRQSITDLAATIPEPQVVDLSAIEEKLRTLEGRLAAIGAGASSADASALAENLVGLEENLAALTAEVAGIDGRVAANDGAVQSLATEVEAAKTAIAAQNRTLGGAEIGPAVRLPLVLSGLESAFATGRPFEAELQSLVALLPDLVVPEPVTRAAGTGLPRPDALASRFDAAVPDILAGRTGESTGDWAQDAVEWAKALLALRPAEETEGEAPEAIVSRLEAAVDRHDFQAAAALLGELPEPMRLAAGEIGEAILAHAEASRFIAGLRAQALAVPGTPN